MEREFTTEVPKMRLIFPLREIMNAQSFWNINYLVKFREIGITEESLQI